MSDAPQRLRVDSPAALLAVVPYLCRYHPREGNLVVVGFQGSRAAFAAVGELPKQIDGESTPITRAAEQLAAYLRSNGADRAVIIGYGTAAEVDPAATLLPEVFVRQGIETFECLRVTGQRWWSYLCTDPVCCSPEGNAYDPRSHPAAAQLAAAGLVAYPQREAVAAQIEPVTDPGRREAMRVATAAARARLASELEGRQRQEAEQWRRQAGAEAVSQALAALQDNQPLSDERAAWLILLVSDITVRDLTALGIDGDDVDVRLWADLTRRAVPELVAAPATLCGFAAWQAGNGTLARFAAQRALQADSTYRLAALLLHALDRGMPPPTVQQQRITEWQPPDSAA